MILFSFANPAFTWIELELLPELFNELLVVKIIIQLVSTTLALGLYFKWISNRWINLATNSTLWLILIFYLVMNYYTEGTYHFGLCFLGTSILIFMYIQLAWILNTFLLFNILAVMATVFFITHHEPEDFTFYIVSALSIAMGFGVSIRRMETLKESAQNESMYQLLAEHTNDVIVMYRPETFIIDYISPSLKQMTGWEPEEVWGLSVYDFVHPEEIRMFQYFFKTNSIIQNDFLSLKHQVRNNKGDYLWVETVYSALRNKRGKLTHFLGSMRSIDKQVTYERELKSYNLRLETANRQLLVSNKELEQFAHIASHDLKEPLRTVASYVQLIKLRYGDRLGEEGQEFVDFAVGGVKRMHALITDLLAFSKVGASKSTVEEVDLNAVLSDAQQNLESKIRETEANLDIPYLPIIQGDRFQLVQLFQNLLDNAIKYRKPNIPPEVILSYHQEPTTHIFKVKDNGIGIKPEFSEKIFDIFNRLHNMHHYEGTGIGLAICKRVVDNHKGVVRVESEEGEGALFIVELPKQLEVEDRH